MLVSCRPCGYLVEQRLEIDKRAGNGLPSRSGVLVDDSRQTGGRGIRFDYRVGLGDHLDIDRHIGRPQLHDRRTRLVESATERLHHYDDTGWQAWKPVRAICVGLDAVSAVSSAIREFNPGPERLPLPRPCVTIDTLDHESRNRPVSTGREGRAVRWNRVIGTSRR